MIAEKKEKQTKRLDTVLNALYITSNDGRTVKSDPQSDGTDSSRIWEADQDGRQLSCQDGTRRDDSDAANGIIDNLGGAGGGC
jgi:hypothetical protein